MDHKCTEIIKRKEEIEAKKLKELQPQHKIENDKYTKERNEYQKIRAVYDKNRKEYREADHKYRVADDKRRIFQNQLNNPQ